MGKTHEMEHAPSRESNGAADVEQLTAIIAGLREECANLRQALAKAEAERDFYLKEAYANARATLRFQDVDLTELQKSSAGPVELIG